MKMIKKIVNEPITVGKTWFVVKRQANLYYLHLAETDELIAITDHYPNKYEIISLALEWKKRRV
jgi:hypothetical protein